MKVTIVAGKPGRFQIHIKPTRRGERRVSPSEDVPQALVGEAIGNMVHEVRRDEPAGAPVGS